MHKSSFPENKKATKSVFRFCESLAFVAFLIKMTEVLSA